MIVGENGSGKSHVLKAAYTVAAVMARGEKDSGSPTPTKNYLETAVARKLRGVFRPDELGRSARRQTGRNRCEVEAWFKPKSQRMGFSFNTSSKTEVTIDHLPDPVGRKPSGLPADTRTADDLSRLRFSLRDDRLAGRGDLARHLYPPGAPLARGPRLAEITRLLDPLEDQLGGKVVLDQDRFYLKTQIGNMEAHLVAEGLRKLAMIARLIATGSLIGTGSLFWDEPEANLNPKVIKQVARTILQLCQSGIQVFVASHSLFLMRELDILLKTDEFPIGQDEVLRPASRSKRRDGSARRHGGRHRQRSTLWMRN